MSLGNRIECIGRMGDEYCQATNTMGVMFSYIDRWSYSNLIDMVIKTVEENTHKWRMDGWLIKDMTVVYESCIGLTAIGSS